MATDSTRAGEVVQRATKWRAWRYYGGFYRGQDRGNCVPPLMTIVASMAQSFLQLAIVLLIRTAFDDVVPLGDYRTLTIVGAGIVALYLLNGGLSLYARHTVLGITKLVIQRIRSDLLHKLYAVSRAYYSEADLSRLHTMAVQDTERLDIMSNALIALLIPAVLISGALSGVLAWLDWRLFLVLATVAPLLIIASKAMHKMLRGRVRDFHRSFETFSRGISFVLEAMDLTRIQSAEELETERQSANLEDLRLTSGRMAWLMSAYGLLQDTVAATSGVLILVVGGWSVSTGKMTIGELFSFFTAVALLRTHLHTVSLSLPRIIEGHESLMTLYHFAQIQDSRPYCGTRRIAFSGKVSLTSVCFGYKGDPVLRDIDLTIEPGATVALVGPSGAGKSTIAHLILGFYRPETGQLQADEYPYDDLDMVHLRRHIGVVGQDPIMFPGTIWENITYGCPNPATEQVHRAAELAMAREFIEQLPQGYETFVGERGVLLSGGQRQRIAIARALLRRPRLLILDEPTSHLDEEAVLRLLDNLNHLDEVTAKLIISHDRHIVDSAERIYVLREGQIVVRRDSES